MDHSGSQQYNTTVALFIDNTSTVENRWREILDIPLPARYMTTVFGVIAFLANCMVLYLYKHIKKLHTPGNKLISSLTLADFLYGVLIIICSTLHGFTRHRQVGLHTSQEVGCMLLRFTMPFTGLASYWSLVAITTDRYIAICKPLSHNAIVTPFRVTMAISVLWFGSFMVSFLMFVPFPGVKVVLICQSKKFGYSKVFIGLFILLGFIIPFIVVTILYIYIFKEIRQRHHKMKHGELSVAVSPRTRKTSLGKLNMSKSSRLFLIIIMMFLAAWIPLFTVHVSNILCKDCLPNAMMGGLLGYGLATFSLTKALNPLVYTLGNPDFKNAVMKCAHGVEMSNKGSIHL